MILLPAFALMAFASYKLWLDYQPKAQLQNEQSQNLEPIGKILVSDNNVKRKSENENLWQESKRNDAVYNNDSIRTGSNSEAVIQLNDKSIIEVQSNSLIVLQKKSENFKIDFKTGDVKTKTESNQLQIQIKDSVINTKASELSLKTDTKQNTQIRLQTGQAKIQENKSGKSIELEKSKEVEITNTGKTQSFVHHISLNTPADESIIYDPNKEILFPFTWLINNDLIQSENFEISTSPNFEKNLTIKRSTHLAIEAPIKKGINYWRVSAQVKNTDGKIENVFSKVRSIQLLDDHRIKLLEPEQLSLVSLNPGQENIDFKWSSNLEAKTYLLEISKSSDFKIIYKTLSLSEQQTSLKQMPDDLYYWRVSAFSAENKILAKSSSQQFQLKSRMPNFPILEKPKNLSKWVLPSPVVFSWQIYTEAKKYKLQIASDLSFKNLIYEKDSLENQTTWPWEALGNYYWRVLCYNEQNLKIAQSQIYAFSVEVNKIENKLINIGPNNLSEMEVNTDDPNSMIAFKWNSNLDKTHTYRLRLFQDAELKQEYMGASVNEATKNIDETQNALEKNISTSKETSNLFYNLSIKQDGTYYWYIEAVKTTANGVEVVESSTLFMFRVQTFSPLVAPSLSQPEDLKILNWSKPQDLILSWQPIEKASKYKIYIEKKNESTQSFEKWKEDYSLKAEWNMLAPNAGIYRWKVSAFDEKSREGKHSVIWNFQINIKPSLSPPKLKPVIIN